MTLGCCAPCNVRKGSKPVEEWLALLSPDRCAKVARLYARRGIAQRMLPFGVDAARQKWVEPYRCGCAPSRGVTCKWHTPGHPPRRGSWEKIQFKRASA